MSTLFKGLSDNYGPQQAGGGGSQRQPSIVFPAHVLEVCTNANSPLYETARDIGKIRFRDLHYDNNLAEKNVGSLAYPLDRSFLRYPYPGEQVMIFFAYGEALDPNGTVMRNTFFYSFVVSAFHNISYNQHPFLGVDTQHIDPDNPFLSYDTAKGRFDKSANDINSVS